MTPDAKRAAAFVVNAFLENPHYSFGDGRIMGEHSLAVREVALKIAEEVGCDRELVELEALFHDIGKIIKADEKTLLEHHAEMGYDAVKDFLPSLGLDLEREQKLVAFLKGDFSSVEAKIVKDADIVAFYEDRRLQDVFKEWADRDGLPQQLERKIARFDKMNFSAGKKMAARPRAELKERWGY